MQDNESANGGDGYSLRIAEITKEFTDGFQFISGYPKSVTFFGSSQSKPGSKYYEDAISLSSKIVKELGYSVLTGGSSGIMEAANKGAAEAGGSSLGLHIKLPHEQVVNSFANRTISFHYFFVRKVCLSFSAEAFVFYPGGYGTLDEFFEILTLVQTEKIPRVPIICIGSEYWNSLKDFVRKELLERSAIQAGDENLFYITDSHAETLDLIKKAPIRAGLPFNGEHHS